jgi:hypothetical protein
MASINDIVINISLLTKPITQKGFGLPLVVGNRADTDPLYKNYAEYSDLDSMVSDGFTSSDDEYKMVSAMFAQSPRPDVVAVYIRDSVDTLSDSLDELAGTYNDWYILLVTERDNTSLNSAGDWIAAREKLFFGCSSSVMALSGRNNTREAYVIHDQPDTFPDAAWVGFCLPRAIGSITWKWKAPTGVVAADFTLTELNNIRKQEGYGYGQTFTERSGIVYSNEGITTGGQYIDVIMSRDYIRARLEESLFALQVRSDKISFDNTGFAQMESEIRAVLKTAGTNGIIARATTEEDLLKSDEGEYMYKVSVPSRSDVPINDRAERKLSGIEFSFTIAGAIHSVDVNGVIEV